MHITTRNLNSATISIRSHTNQIYRLVNSHNINHTRLLSRFARILHTNAKNHLVHRNTRPLSRANLRRTTRTRRRRTSNTITTSMILNTHIRLLISSLTIRQIRRSRHIILRTRTKDNVSPMALPTNFARFKRRFTNMITTLTDRGRIRNFRLFGTMDILRQDGILTRKQTLTASVKDNRGRQLSGVRVLLFRRPLRRRKASRATPASRACAFRHGCAFLGG